MEGGAPANEEREKAPRNNDVNIPKQAPRVRFMTLECLGNNMDKMYHIFISGSWRQLQAGWFDAIDCRKHGA